MTEFERSTTIERLHDYAKELARVAAVYREAATAVGLRKDAAKYLAAEADRLDSESRGNANYAEDLFWSLRPLGKECE